jgi:mannose-6-phosphate isomerase-like protein (cupin superfamily)
LELADDYFTGNDMPRLRVTPREGRKAPVEPGHLSAILLQHGSMQLRWYSPNNVDPQTPHDRDELYVVVAGSAVFVRAEEVTPFGEEEGITPHGNERVSVEPGDALFVPAGVQHRFEAMSLDFGAWIIFYGPEGGEPPVLPGLPRLSLLEP